MPTRISHGVILIGALALSACGPGPAAKLTSRSLSQSQRLEDFAVLAASFRELYGARSYKEARFNFRFETLVDQARGEVSAAANDSEAIGAFKRFTAAFHDAHVHLTIPGPGSSSHIAAYDVPVYVNPFAGKVLVTQSPEAAELGIRIGDELTSIDGLPTADYLTKIKRYEAYATAASDSHLINFALHRPFYMTELVPQQPTVILGLSRADGSTYQTEVYWTEERSDTGATTFPYPTSKADRDAERHSTDSDASQTITNFSVAQVSDLDRGLDLSSDGATWANGAAEPFFATPAVVSRLHWSKAAASSETLKKYGLPASGADDIYAVLYKHQERVVLLIRQPKYVAGPGGDSHRLVLAYKAVLDQYQSIADVLVIDQTHNPGGELDYAQAFAALFLQKPAGNLVQALHADRRWIYELQRISLHAIGGEAAARKTAADYAAHAVDAAIDQGAELTAPLPLIGLQTLRPDAEFHWSKPVLLLADELSGSCGDIVPMLLQRSGSATVFGATTMGAGGNVETVITLPNSQIGVNLSRGLYTSYRPDHVYPSDQYVENTGIAPDIAYTLTASDVRGGLTAYTQAFSTAAVALVHPAPVSKPDEALTAQAPKAADPL